VSRRLFAVAPLLLFFLASSAGAQPAARRLTTLESIRQFPGFYHLQNVLVRGEFAENGSRIVFRADEHQMDVLLGDTKTVTGLVEVRAQLLDIGRMEPTDPRLSRYEGARDADRWPKPGEELVLSVTGVTGVDTSTTPTVRALSLEPWKFEGQSVTVTGQFRGRNLFGDLPGSPARSSYDFIMRGGDGAIWVTGLRPRGKGFDLNVDARVDTAKWVEVTGVVKRERTMVTVEAKTIRIAEAPTAAPAAPDDEAAEPPPAPGEVVFSSPTGDETEVAVSAPIRIQFSRGLNPATLAGNFRVVYVAGGAAEAPIEFKTTYDAATRAVEITLARPPQRFSTVTVETLEGLKTFDGAAVTPWKVTFSFGG
jgi:hypothetical protein